MLEIPGPEGSRQCRSERRLRATSIEGSKRRSKRGPTDPVTAPVVAQDTTPTTSPGISLRTVGERVRTGPGDDHGPIPLIRSGPERGKGIVHYKDLLDPTAEAPPDRRMGDPRVRGRLHPGQREARRSVVGTDPSASLRLRDHASNCTGRSRPPGPYPNARRSLYHRADPTLPIHHHNRGLGAAAVHAEVPSLRTHSTYSIPSTKPTGYCELFRMWSVRPGRSGSRKYDPIKRYILGEGAQDIPEPLKTIIASHYF